MKMTTITCDTCGNKTEKPLSEINRQKKNGRDKFYCSLSCSGKKSHRHLRKYNNSNKLVADNRKDEYSAFRSCLRCCKRRSDKECNIDLDYLKSLWDNQDGKCAITNIKMKERLWNTAHDPEQASLDRIDSSKGYIKGNVRFVCLFINYAKNSWDDNTIIKFLRMINV